jgi:glycerophosphoryl diester phosphodiesterase
MSINFSRTAFDAPNRKKFNKKPFIESHRGCNKEEAENTMSAFRRAIEYNCDSLELDVWLSSDGIPMVIHGSKEGKLEETTNGNGFINDFTLIELQRLITANGEQIPTLEAVLTLCKDKIFVNIEIKDKHYEAAYINVFEIIEVLGIHKQIAISSFKHKYWDEIKKLSHDIEFGFLFEPEELDYIFDKPNATLNIHQSIVTSEIVNKAHDGGMGVQAWFKMDDVETEEVYEFLFTCGVDIICCNYPNKAKEFRDKFFS